MKSINTVATRWLASLHSPALLLALAFDVATSAHAAVFTWNGGGADNNWQTGTNWTNTVPPATDGSASLTFSGNTHTVTTNNVAADTVFTGINLVNDNSSGKTNAFTLSGNRITLGGNISSTASSAAIMDTMSLPVLLNGTRTATLNTLHHLTISGVISESGGSYGLTKAGSGELTLSNTNNTYSGKTTLSGGRLYFSSLKNVGEGPSSLGAPTVVTNGTIDVNGRITYTGGSTTSDRVFNFVTGNQFDNSGSGTLTLTGGFTGSGSTPVFRGNGTFVVSGLLALGGGGVTRTDGGTVYLTNPTNAFTGNVTINDGIISVDTLADAGTVSPIGAGTTIYIGQANGTIGRFRYTGTNDASCNRSITIIAQPKNTNGGIIENAAAGKTLTLGGNVSVDLWTNTPTLQLTGVGNGVLSGVVNGAMRVTVNGSNIWTLAGANVYTGATTVSSGTLLINGSTAAGSAVSVSAGATLGGTGTVSGVVSVSANGILAPGNNGIGTLRLANAGAAALTLNGITNRFEVANAAGVSDAITISGALVLNGANVVALSFPLGAAPAGTYTLMTYASRSGSGTLALDQAYSNTRLLVGDTSVTLVVGGPSLVWLGGSAANAWDTSTANWSPSLYADNAVVVFDDTGSASPAVNITPNPVAPFSVSVNTTNKAYTIGGAGIGGAGGLTKSGATALTLTGSNTYSGVTTVGVNGISNTVLIVNNNKALGSTASGTLVNGGSASTENRLVLGSGVTVTDETLTLGPGPSANRAALRYTLGSGSGTWDGNIVLAGTATYLGSDTPGGTLIVGLSADDTITTSSSAGFSVRGSGDVTINSRISIGAQAINRDDPGTFTLNSTSNTLLYMNIAQGTLKLGVSDALPATALLTIGKNSGINNQATFDLNGKSQAVASLSELHMLSSNGFQRITSAAPATLIVSNSTANSFGTEGSTISGAVSLVKMGAGTLTLTGTNSYSGATIVSNGTLIVSGTGNFGVNSTNITVAGGTLLLSNSVSIADSATVRIADGGGAKVNLAAGVNETVGYLRFGDKPKRAGTYSATASGVDFIDTDHFAGSGILTVRHGNGGTLIRVQ